MYNERQGIQNKEVTEKRLRDYPTHLICAYLKNCLSSGQEYSLRSIFKIKIYLKEIKERLTVRNRDLIESFEIKIKSFGETTNVLRPFMTNSTNYKLSLQVVTQPDKIELIEITNNEILSIAAKVDPELKEQIDTLQKLLKKDQNLDITAQ